MKKTNFAVIGSGIGGSLFCALNKNEDLLLFEKDKNLGGCAATFKKDGNFYNVGATTLVGYEENMPLKKMFDKVGVTPNLQKSNIAIQVIQQEKVINRNSDFEYFLEQINSHYPHKNNRAFWEKVKYIDEKFWSIKNIFYTKYSLENYIKSISSSFHIFSKIGFDIFVNGENFVKKYFPDISYEYENFINANLLITIQSTYKETSALFLALGLSYPFHDVYSVNGGMGTIFSDLLKDIDVKNNEKIISIEKRKEGFLLQSNTSEYISKNVVLNSTVYDSWKLFVNEDIKSYYNQFSFVDRTAFVIYLSLDSKQNFLHHYQIILDKNIPNCISNSFFISFSDIKDKKLSNGSYSITISTHSKVSFWSSLEKQEYEEKKAKTVSFILKELKRHLNIKENEIKDTFSATSSTFKNFISRQNCGGTTPSFANMLKMPTVTTPFNGLYNVGDTILAQGWSGVAMSVNILNESIKNG